MHPDYPIEQMFRSNEPGIHQQLLQQAWGRPYEREQTFFVADYDGLRVLGANELALDRVAKRLRERFGTALFAEVPIVRYDFGMPVLEPYMTVFVKAPYAYLALVRHDFARRRGRITRLVKGGEFALEGEAPLADLLGYPERMRILLRGDWKESRVAIWLSRYVPIDGFGPEAA
jgi:hypothetical protein